MVISHPFSRKDIQHSLCVIILCPFPLIITYAREGMDFNITKIMMFGFDNDPSDIS